MANSLKYAFPAGKGGEICVDLRLSDDNQFTLMVRDNGVGFPKELDFRHTKTLGLQLVNTLTDQLEGTIRLENSGGTGFKIQFPKLKEETGLSQ